MMKATKENAAEAREELAWIADKSSRLCERNQGLNAADWKRLRGSLSFINQFLTAAEQQLPAAAE